MYGLHPPATQNLEKNDPENQILAFIKNFLSTLDQDYALPHLTLHAHLVRDLGIYSLAKAQLILQLEQHFSIRLPPKSRVDIETIQDIVHAVFPTLYSKESARAPLKLRAQDLVPPELLDAAFQKKYPLRGFFRKGASFCYSLYTAALVTLTISPFVLLLTGLRGVWARRVARIYLRMIFRLAGCSVALENQRAHTQPRIYVSNHASVFDGVLLIAQLPPDTALVLKKELAQVPLLGFLIKKMGYITVERFEFEQSVQDYQKMVSCIQQGGSVAIFSEGTIFPVPCLLPLNLGAFQAAVDTGAPIVPIGIRGSRRLLRAKHRLMRPARLRIRFAEALYPEVATPDLSWAEVLRLRRTVQRILPTLVEEKYWTDFIAG